MCTHPGHAAPAGPWGWLGVRLPQPGPLPTRGTVEAELVQLLRRPAGPPRLRAFFQAAQVETSPRSAGPGSPHKPSPRFSTWPSRRRDRCCRQDGPSARALARVCTNTLTPCAWPGGVGPRERTWAAPHHARVLGPTDPRGPALSPAGPPPRQHSHGRGQRGHEGRWYLGHLQKFPCLPQVPEAPIHPSAKACE